MIIRVCAWCKRPKGFLARILLPFKSAERISHGICWACQKKLLQELEKPLEGDSDF